MLLSLAAAVLLTFWASLACFVSTSVHSFNAVLAKPKKVESSLFGYLLLGQVLLVFFFFFFFFSVYKRLTPNSTQG